MSQQQLTAPPHDLQTERALLALAVLDGDALAETDGVLEPGDFYAPAHGEIFRAMVEVQSSGAPIDTVLIESQLKIAGKLDQCREALDDIGNRVPVGDAGAYARRIRDLSACRAVIRRALQLVGLGQERLDDVDDFLDLAETALSNVCERRSGALSVVPIGDALHAAYTELTRKQAAGETLAGCATGLYDLDDALCGLTPGHLVVLAGRPGMGKSALANQISLGVARSTAKPVLVLSLEMQAEQVATRILSSESGVHLSRIRSAQVQQHELGELARTCDELSKLPICYIEDRSVRFPQLRREAKRLARHGGLALIVVDYLQLMRAEGREQNREQEIAKLSGSLKTLAGEMRCPVLALSQLNRGVESRSDKRPMISDLRESGAIEQDADTILFVYRDEVYHPATPDRGIAEVIVAKQRSGAVGTIKLVWSKEFTRFGNRGQRQEGFAYDA